MTGYKKRMIKSDFSHPFFCVSRLRVVGRSDFLVTIRGCRRLGVGPFLDNIAGEGV